MMEIIKRGAVVSFLMATIIVTGSCYATNDVGLGKENDRRPCDTTILSKIGEIDRDKTVNVNGIAEPIYCTFKNKDTALKNINMLAGNLLQAISQKNNLTALSDKNWQSYREGLSSLDIGITEKFHDESIALRQFFDIYENDSRNNEILSLVSAINNSNYLSATSKRQLATMLPCYSNISLDENNTRMRQSSVLNAGRNLPNLNAAISYASSYATTPNSGNYQVFWEDCTNFASQILFASGVSQVITNNENTGWWHKKTLFSHQHSISWVRSDTFARYMGIGFGIFVHQTFSQNIKKGDFIALDKTYDGTWDHLGFVVDKNSSLTTQNGYTYYNYRVAQHTSNYLLWVSNPNNHWEEVGGQGGRYGRVRR